MSELEATRHALEEAVAHAAEAAELARLLEDYRRRLEQASQREAEAMARLREAEERLKLSERHLGKLAKSLAEQRYQTEVAQWKLESVRESRWLRLGGAINSSGKNPARLARELRSVRAPAQRRPAPKRSDFPPEVPEIPVKQPAAAAPAPPPKVSAPLAEGFVVPKGPLARSYMTVACIVDRQSEALFRYEWRQVTNFGPENWLTMLDEHQPNLLLVESVRPGARQGNGGRWLEALALENRALRDLVEECKRRGIRTLFWHSGGPLSAFVPAAMYFDHVLTINEARAREWRAALKHDRVGVLPYAVQPRVHNLVPAVDGGRTEEVVTLGTVPLSAMGVEEPKPAAKPVPNPAVAEQDAPAEPPAPVGPIWRPLPGQEPTDKISYDDLLTAYRRPAVVVAGQDADPRTLAELAACGTPVVELPAVKAGRKPEPVVDEVAALLADADRRAVQAHLAWRATVSVTPLLDPILDMAGLPSVRGGTTITAIAAVRDEAELDHLLAQVRRQAYAPGQLVVVTEGVDVTLTEKAASAVIDGDVVVRGSDGPVTRGAALDRALRLADGDLIAVLDPRDLYGEHYLADLVRHFAAVEAEVLGKASFYAHIPEAGATLLRQPGTEHRFLPEVAGATILARRPALTELGIADVSEEWDESLMRQCRAEGVRVYSADRYSYVCRRDTAEHRLFRASQLQGYVPAEPLALI
ncbi:hypothetical protein AB0K60_05465 [Thermopolyspora sp. NPDC052614]|uniref:hypothetical protein n=1 Tax=Thermopolyspora sp. NPDC052614 TaxID=3155682 RepID=UPI00343C1AC1